MIGLRFSNYRYVHPTADLTGDLIRALYGRDVRLVRHDHDCLTQCESEEDS